MNFSQNMQDLVINCIYMEGGGESKHNLSYINMNLNK